METGERDDRLGLLGRDAWCIGEGPAAEVHAGEHDALAFRQVLEVERRIGIRQLGRHLVEVGAGVFEVPPDPIAPIEGDGTNRLHHAVESGAVEGDPHDVVPKDDVEDADLGAAGEPPVGEVGPASARSACQLRTGHRSCGAACAAGE
jgi:hypothetical protein